MAAPAGTIERLRDELAAIGPMVVAFSGGTDSALVARVATETLGPDRVVCATAVSPSLAPEERAACRDLAREWGLRHREVLTAELDDPRYVANGADRCAHCKDALLDAFGPLVDALGAPGPDGPDGPGGSGGSGGTDGPAGPGGRAAVVLGVNLDDLGDHRPGQQAAAVRGARFPLVDAGFTKAAVRARSRELGLRTWDKPAAACLASRVPYGTPVTLGTLSTVAAAERALRGLGFAELRVRHYGETARIEVPKDALGRVVAVHDEVAAAVHAAGYRYVTLDLDGLRSGNLNAALGGDGPGVPGHGMIDGAIDGAVDGAANGVADEGAAQVALR